MDRHKYSSSRVASLLKKTTITLHCIKKVLIREKCKGKYDFIKKIIQQICAFNSQII